VNGWKGRIRIYLTGTRVAQAASTGAPPVVALFPTIQELGANLDEEALGEHVTVAPSLARS